MTSMHLLYSHVCWAHTRPIPIDQLQLVARCRPVLGPINTAILELQSLSGKETEAMGKDNLESTGS